MPHDYPKNPPRAAFKTRIYHPNVDESTGTICLDTLKRDWQPTLTLRDILMVSSDLLLYPEAMSLTARIGHFLPPHSPQPRLGPQFHSGRPSTGRLPFFCQKSRVNDLHTRANTRQLKRCCPGSKIQRRIGPDVTPATGNYKLPRNRTFENHIAEHEARGLQK